jgi:hypothetical protein
MIKSKKEMIESEEICEYCRLQDRFDELPPPITKFSMGCEGRFCDESYDNYKNSVS